MRSPTLRLALLLVLLFDRAGGLTIVAPGSRRLLDGRTPDAVTGRHADVRLPMPMLTSALRCGRCKAVRMIAAGKPLGKPNCTSDEVMLSEGCRLASDITVAVYGGGSFGTAMACVLGRKGVRATLVVRKPEVVEQINTKHTNPYYQSDLLLPEAVRATLDAEAAFADADFIFHAVPVQYSREALQKVAHLMPEGVPVVSLSKGIETSTLCLMSDMLPQVCARATARLAWRLSWRHALDDPAGTNAATRACASRRRSWATTVRSRSYPALRSRRRSCKALRPQSPSRQPTATSPTT